ncbi:MAG: DUF3710 domain-containing protein [Segniliparus sp.]|uniref:DUF3710 domain-containing protein n=1 Tax=Segniliparus sp. TaxID=2804064 RepID=UPI003F3FCE3D
MGTRGDDNAADRHLGATKVDLGSIVLYVPEGSRLRLAFGPGDALLAAALLCPFGEVEVRAHAAPRQRYADAAGGEGLAGQWRAMLAELADELHAAGLQLAFEDGPWGRELAATHGSTCRRLVGRDGGRWTLVAVAAGPAKHAEMLTGFIHEVLAGTEVRRGDEPQPAKALLPLRIVDPGGLGDWERADLVPHEPGAAEPEPFRPRFPDPGEPGAKGSAMQQLRALQP